MCRRIRFIVSIPSFLSRPRRVSTTGLLLALALLACGTSRADEAPAAQRWVLDDPASVAGQAAEVWGSPKVCSEQGRKSLCFDGNADGLLLAVNPIAGWKQFTIEVLIKPDGSGAPEQRFLHIQDTDLRRALIETRLTPDRQWSLDTFLFTSQEHRLTLLDRTKLHPTDQWYWVALTYDGRTMRHYVNGTKELEGEVEISAFVTGRISLGVRQNKVNWYKGCISEIRFSPEAIDPAALQRVVP